ncbi:hypothetical protein RRG08_040597 [Elysia crispata]|uniref:Uncharacterized protein n=1 Tax=Elysia crispata TaxID=231223 RepID=A0AAE1D0L9_9GAST|nr:hypothetical protein RRG08_040597 [Elysia crispata]
MDDQCRCFTCWVWRSVCQHCVIVDATRKTSAPCAVKALCMPLRLEGFSAHVVDNSILISSSNLRYSVLSKVSRRDSLDLFRFTLHGLRSSALIITVHGGMSKSAIV